MMMAMITSLIIRSGIMKMITMTTMMTKMMVMTTLMMKMMIKRE